MKNKIYSLLILLCVISCNMSDYTENLPNGYLYISDSQCDKFIGTTIGSTVISYKFDKRYVTVCQIDSCECLKKKNIYENNKYFILDTETGKVSKALNHSDFKKEVFKLKLSKELILDDKIEIKYYQ